jgi:hypothetical protein
MSDIVTERCGSIVRNKFNRPGRKNARTSTMYTMADVPNNAAKDTRTKQPVSVG